MIRNEPMIQTQLALAGGSGTYYLGLRHALDEDWLLGVGLSFKGLERRDKQTELSFWTLTHESYYMVRLYSPTFLLVGPKILYLFPAQRTGFPIRRDADFETEVGAAFSLGILHVFSQRFCGVVRVDRWRGTRTNKFHGIEVGVGVSYSPY
jgi:hypothetical protein